MQEYINFMLKEMKVKTLERNSGSAPAGPLEMLLNGLEERAGSEKFFLRAVKDCIEDLIRTEPNGDDTHGEVIGSLSDNGLVDLLVEEIYLETLIGACEEKAEAAKRRHRTVKLRFKQVVCDRFDLPDDEPIKIEIPSLRVFRGDRAARIQGFRKDVEKLFALDEAELREVIDKEGEDTFKGDLASALMGDHRDEVVKLCNAIFEANEKDQAFLQKVSDDEDIPKPLRAMADYVIKERGIKCPVNKIIEWD